MYKKNIKIDKPTYLTKSLLAFSLVNVNLGLRNKVGRGNTYSYIGEISLFNK